MSRQSRVTADVTLEAHNMLRDYCKKHERSKGFLIEKMIRKFCSDAELTSGTQVAVVDRPRVKRFAPPTIEEVTNYMQERTGTHHFDEPGKFRDFYESNGWKVGKNKMKCWKAAVRNWLKNYKEKSGNKNILQKSADSNWEDGINEIF